MVFHTEIKDFIKNTLILTLFFTLVLHLSWGYLSTMFGFSAHADTNDNNFAQMNISYMGTPAAAISLNVGSQAMLKNNTPIALSNEIISVAELMQSPAISESKLLGPNMYAITSYVSLLKTDVKALLDASTDRSKALDDYITMLNNTYLQTQDRIGIVDNQITDLQAIVTNATNDMNTAQSTMQNAYNGLDPSGVDPAIEAFIVAKNKIVRAKVYLIYLQKFRNSYIILQNQNKLIQGVLTSNHTALIKNATVVVPSSGTDYLKKLNLLQSQADYDALQTIN